MVDGRERERNRNKKGRKWRGGDVEGKVVSASHFDRVLFQYSFCYPFFLFFFVPKNSGPLDSKTNGVLFKHKENEMMLKFRPPSFQTSFLVQKMESECYKNVIPIRNHSSAVKIMMMMPFFPYVEKGEMEQDEISYVIFLPISIE